LTSAPIDVLVLFMSTPTAERREEMLGLLAEKTLALACDLQQQALEAQDVDEKVRLAAAFAGISRACRLSIALHAQLEAQRLRAEREAERELTDPSPEPPPEPLKGDRELAVYRKTQRVERAVERCVWSEHDWEDENEQVAGESLMDDLRDRLADLSAGGEAFLEADVDLIIEGLCRELGVEPPDRPVRLELPAIAAQDGPLDGPFPATAHAAAAPNSS
jgi:hypothetical protein